MGKTWRELFNDDSDSWELLRSIYRKKLSPDQYDATLEELMRRGSWDREEASQEIEEYLAWEVEGARSAAEYIASCQIHCPTCNSTNVHKISGLAKAGSVAMWGIFSQKVKKQFHCDHCGYEW